MRLQDLFLQSISAILDPPGASVMQLACSIPNDRLETIQTYLANLTDRSFPKEIAIIDELRRRQALISGTQGRGTKRKADGRQETADATQTRGSIDKRVHAAGDRERDLGLGGSTLLDAFGLIDLANPGETTSQDIPVFLQKIWNPLVETFRSASSLDDDEMLPEGLVGLDDQDIEVMIKDGSALEKRANTALGAVAGP